MLEEGGGERGSGGGEGEGMWTGGGEGGVLLFHAKFQFKNQSFAFEFESGPS